MTIINIFKKRPLALGCFALLLCLYFSYFLGNVINILIVALGVLGLFALILWTCKAKSKSSYKWLIALLPLCLCLIICSLAATLTFSRDKKLLNTYENTTQGAQFLVTEVIYSNSYETLSIAKTELDGEKIKLLLSTVGENGPEVGDRISATVQLRALEETGAGYSEKERYITSGIFLFAEAEEYELVSSGEFVLTSVFVEVNTYLKSLFDEYLDEEASSLCSAMLLGNKSALDYGVRRDFSRLGISHILALSGIHISLVTGLFNAFLSTIKMRKRLKYLSLVGMIMAFVCITGFSPSAIRAGFMLIIFYALSLFGTDSDSVTSLFVAVSIICIIDPYSIFSVSLILSFSAMLGCFCSSYYTKRVRPLYKIRPKPLRSMVYSLISSIIVVLFTLPIMAIMFDYVSIFAPIFNIIFVPLLTLVLYLAPFILLLGAIPYLSYAVIYPAQYLVKLVLTLTENISRADFLTVSFVNAGQKIGVGIILVSVVLALVLSKRKIKYTLSVLGVGVCVFAVSVACTTIVRYNEVTISSYDLYSCDVVAIESNNEVMIIEISSPTATTSLQSYYQASSLGYSDIDTYAVTDYSTRTAKAIDTVTDSAMVRKILLPKPQNDTEKELYDEVYKITKSKKIKLMEIPEKYDFGDTCVDFMEYSCLKRSLKRCVAFSVEANNSRYTYLGASAFELFNRFPDKYAESSSVVVFGSYGPAYATPYSYDLRNADYVVFHGNSEDYIRCQYPRKREAGHKFTFK